MWQASPADQFTQLNGPYTVNVSGDVSINYDTETEALNSLLTRGDNHYKVTDAVSKITYYISTNDTCTDRQQFTTTGSYVSSQLNIQVVSRASITLIPYKP